MLFPFTADTHLDTIKRAVIGAIRSAKNQSVAFLRLLLLFWLFGLFFLSLLFWLLVLRCRPGSREKHQCDQAHHRADSAVAFSSHCLRLLRRRLRLPRPR